MLAAGGLIFMILFILSCVSINLLIESLNISSSYSYFNSCYYLTFSERDDDILSYSNSSFDHVTCVYTYMRISSHGVVKTFTATMEHIFAGFK